MKKEISKPEKQSRLVWIVCRRFLFATISLSTVIASAFSISAQAQTNIPGLSDNSVSCLVPEAGAPSCATQTSPGSSTIDQAIPQHVGNPINVITGNKYQYELDYQSINSSLTLARHYNSTLAAYDTGIGQGWRHTYQVVLTRVSDYQVDIVQSDGRLIPFYLETNNANLYKSQATNDGYIEMGERSVWHLEDGRRMYFQGSFLVSIDMGENKDKLHLDYSSGMLRSVTDSKGDSLRFDYTTRSKVLPKYGAKNTNQPDGSIRTITLPAGQLINYNYGDHRNLISVLYPDDNTLHYKYRHEEWNSQLTDRVSTADNRNSHWSYDMEGRAIGWQEGDNINGLKIVRSLENTEEKIEKDSKQTPSYASVTYADGRKSQYAWSHTQQAQNQGDTMQEIACDNCLPNNATSTLELKESELGIKSEHDTAMQSLRSSLERFTPSNGNIEAVTHYNAEYPHAGGNVSIQITADRTGKIKNLSIGELALSDIVRQSAREDVPECSQGTYFQSTTSFSHDRIQRLGSGGEVCSQDSAVVVEFIYQVENFNTHEGNSAAFKGIRGKANPTVSWYDPMRRYCSMPAGMTCTDLEEDLRMARLSECAYGIVSCEPEFRLVNAAEVNMQDIRFSDQGFDAQLYHDASQNRFILIFRGSDNTGDDWDVNFGQARGEFTRQYDLAYILARDLIPQIGSASLEFSGHSLGGGLATLAALATNRTATVFNTAALQSTTSALYGLNSEYQNASTYVRHIHTEYDPNTVLQGIADDLNWGNIQTAPGVQLEVPNPDHPWMNAMNANATTFSQSLAPVLSHSITAVIHVLQSLIRYHCSP
jgi:hypothetical protein